MEHQKTNDPGSEGHFLSEPPQDDRARRLLDADKEDPGYVMNLSRLWAHEPELLKGVFDVMRAAIDVAVLDYKDRAILVSAAASMIEDSYCSLAWGARLAKVTDGLTAASILQRDYSRLEDSDLVLAEWASKVAGDPNAITPDDVSKLRDADMSDSQILALTVYVAMRIAFSTVNDALGALPDAELRTRVPEPVLNAVTFGRPIA